ncbi:MAG: PKD domain-containing protein, partial [Planctomycetota bacterium]
MADVANPTIQRAIPIVMLITLLALSPARVQSQDGRPIADAGLSRYAATDPVQLDGTGSYDPDDFGPLSYTWRQIAGPSVEATDTDTAAPTINGFTQTDEIQECEFELIVNNGEYDSLPDTVRVVVVPDFGESNLRLENKSFDPNKPTIIYFGGGDCTIGYSGQYVSDPDTLSRANVIDFPNGYTPDSGGGARTYYKYGDMIIAYLSSLAPDYKQPIQSSGWSTGGQPAIDVGICLNQTYRDARYAVNQVTFLDATPFCRDYSASISTFLGSSVDGEQCWADNYVNNSTRVHPGVLNVRLSLSHSSVGVWYGNSDTGNNMNKFNNGVVAGAYWSITGPGKNLQLGPAPGATYAFQWHGSVTSGYMDFFDESTYPGRLPEPVTLLGPVDVGYPNGAVFTCEESENAVGYQLLFGSDSYRVMDYNIISDTPYPPNKVIITLPFEETWWTVRAYDQFGSSIYADPVCTNAFRLSLPIKNLNKDKRYSYIQFAIDDAMDNDEIELSEGIYQENIDFNGKNLTLRSTNPNDPQIVATTVITGDSHNNVVTFSCGEDANCVLAGFTITGGKRGIYCSGSSPTITNCTITGNVNSDMGAGMYI